MIGCGCVVAAMCMFMHLRRPRGGGAAWFDAHACRPPALHVGVLVVVVQVRAVLEAGSASAYVLQAPPWGAV